MSSFYLNTKGCAVFPGDKKLLVIPESTKEKSKFLILTSLKQQDTGETSDKQDKTDSCGENGEKSKFLILTSLKQQDTGETSDKQDKTDSCVENGEKSKFLILTSLKQQDTGETSDKQDKTDSCGENGNKETESSQHTVCANFSPSGSHFALIDEQKQLHLWHIKENEWSLLNIRLITRKAVCLKFNSYEDSILVADRSGDVYSFSITDPNQPGVLLFGHLSMLLDMVISPDDKYVITCDRDEKIRVSCYPNCYNICSYCLGHTQFVSSLSLIPSHPQVLISGSGDGTFKVWKYQESIKLYERNYMADVTMNKDDQTTMLTKASLSKNLISESTLEDEQYSCPAIKQLQCSSTHDILAVTFDSLSCIIMYHYKFIQQSSSFSIVQNQLFRYNSEPTTILFDTQGWLLVFLSAKDGFLQILQPLCNDQSIEFIAQEVDNKYLPMVNLINMQQEFFSDSTSIESSFDILYKKWYDNVDEYQEKKQQKKKNKRLKSNCCTEKQ